MAKRKADLIASLDDFTRAYIECALWSSTDDSGQPLDNYAFEDIALPTLRSMIRDCHDFKAFHQAEWQPEWSDAQAGHDFWLTRNRHGAGFWDRGAAADVASKLTRAAHNYGSVDLVVYRGKVHS